MRVLVVDDEPNFGLILEQTIARCGYEVTVADNPTDALTQLHTRPDVLAVSSDMKLPLMSGLEFGAYLRRLSGTPVLFLMSGPAPVGLLDNPLVAMINKPVRMSDLHHRLGELLQRSTATGSRFG